MVNNISDIEIGRKLKVFRELKGISREEFANLINKKLHYTKFDKNYFSDVKLYCYESGKRQFSAVLLMTCCQILDINIQWFYEDIEKIINNNSSDLISESKNIMLLRLKFNYLIKILDKLTDKKVYEKFSEFLEKLNKENKK